MDAALRTEAKKLRDMGSAAAATHLIEHWPQNHRSSFILMQHVSWAVADQKRLAAHFLPERTFAQGFSYEAFASFMSLRTFLEAIAAVWPRQEGRDQYLLRYHLGPILDRYATSNENQELIHAFLAER